MKAITKLHSILPTIKPGVEAGFRRSILLLISLVGTAAIINAQGGGLADDDRIGKLTGASLVLNATNTQTYTPGNDVLPPRIINVISLSLIEETDKFISADFTASLKIKIEYGESAASANTINEQVFTVGYTKAGGTKYNPRDYFYFSGAKYVKITVTQMPSATTVGSVNITDLLLLENKMMVTRFYNLSTDPAQLQPTFTAPPASIVGDDEVEVKWSWPAKAGNTLSQLEWSWVEDELISSYQVNGVVDYNLLFKNNATRVELSVSQAAYKIPLLYGGTGKLHYRIRALNANKADYRIEGPWSAVQTQSFTGHNNALNWQSTISYAEDGKRKAVMQYYDGTLNSRQTITKENATNTVIGAETLYDGQGRPAVQILPAPLIGTSKIGYTKGLNLFKANSSLNLPTDQSVAEDPANFFDLQPASFPANTPASTVQLTPPLNTTSGAAKYYSAANPERTTGINNSIPDAEGYPYTLTRYTPDATGRVMAQSGIGVAMKMGSSHETRYYYGLASQEELDGLFGTEVGNASHYFKNMVSDANGQMSVSYVDMHGRTIATALAGNSPANLASLNPGGVQYTSQGGSSINWNLLDMGSNIANGNKIEAVNSLLVPAPNSYAFKYELGAGSLKLPTCTQGERCFDCMYDLEISITDESGELPPIVRKFSNINLAADDVCSTAVKSFVQTTGTAATISGNIITFSQQLTPGSYAIRKTLTMSEAALQKFKADYLPKALCKTELQLIDSVRVVFETLTGCRNTPTTTSCQDCMAAIGNDLAAFRTQYLNSIGNPSTVPATTEMAIAAAYTSAKAKCDMLCGTSSELIITKRQLMLADMKPHTGQYAKSFDDGLPAGMQSPMFKKYDVLTSTSEKAPYFRKPLKPNASLPINDYYYTEQNIKDPTAHPGQPPVQHTELNTWYSGYFAQKFVPKWAESLLPYHPEYQKLLFAEQKLGTTYSWISSFTNTSTYLAAKNAGYIFTNASNITDPYYQLSPAPNNGADKTNMATMISSSYQGSSQLSFWRIAFGDVKCKTIPADALRRECYLSVPLVPVIPTDFNALPADSVRDQVWNVFKGLYAAERDRQVNLYIEQNVPMPRGEANALIDEKYILHFPTTTDQVVRQNANNSTEDDFWKNWPSNNGSGLSDLSGISGNGGPGTSQKTCDGYINLWKQWLQQCDQLKNHAQKDTILTEIVTGMLAVCKKGINATNTYGASNHILTDGSSKNFEEVIDAVLVRYSIPKRDWLCNPYVIEFPKPYNKGPVFSKELIGVVESCNCDRLTELKTQASAAGYNPNTLTSFNQYLFKQYGDVLTNALYTAMNENCAKMGSTTCDSTAAAAGCNGVEPKCKVITSFVLSWPQPLPDFLKCGFTGNYKCLSRTQYNNLVNEFKTQFASPQNAGPLFAAGQPSDDALRANALFATFINYRTGFQYTWVDYANALAGVCLQCPPGSTSETLICGNTKPITDTSGHTRKDAPCDKVKDLATYFGQYLYQQRIEQLLSSFEAEYRNKCMAAKSIEKFNVTYTNKEYHYTLYYYDQAGNLVKTVPPKGVRPDWYTSTSPSSFLAKVKASRAANYNVDLPRPHLFTTNYRYNSLGQVIAQHSPDGNTSKFWYDKLGRLVVSQNAQQAIENKYSYTLYDQLGRIIEVGQKPSPTAAMTQTISQNETALKDWIENTGDVREQITLTRYDLPYGIDPVSTIDILNGKVMQKNLRNRVSFTQSLPLASNPQNYHAASFYTYDIHGNVDTLLQDYKGIALTGNSDRFKLIAYRYDLISGKVNMVDYQNTLPDRFLHRYQYDAENRITQVYTSRDSIFWERDAAYNYYRHGPLSRTEIGMQRVQGTDYAYTLQGWLKGINSSNVSADIDMGKDGYASGSPKVARDVLGFVLHYYDQTGFVDYKPIGTASPALARTGTAVGMASLYNGNIGGITINNRGLLSGATNPIPLFYKYNYDQLNRLVTMQTYKGFDVPGNHWNNAVAINDYKETISYDPNGNILKYMRGGDAARQIMDSLNYQYTAGTNRLHSVSDLAPDASDTDYPKYNDIKQVQSNDNYIYDAIGNLKKDVSEGISNITWNVYGKITGITKSNSTISYTYDAAGNRISKTITPTAGTAATTVYVRDASGNVMAVYNNAQAAGSLQLAETHLYGSSRLGIAGALTTATTTINLAAAYGKAKKSIFTRGEKLFELSNHLGNVLVTLSDKKLQVQNGTTGVVGYYNADVITATDYYPFGMTMPGRKYTQPNSNYRFGYNGVEKDNEIAGEGNHLDFKFRGYDPRTGRFWSVDPLASSYPWNSTYAFAENSPIRFLDLEGAEKYDYTYKLNAELGKAELQKFTKTDVDAKGNKLPLSFNYSLNGRNTNASTISQFNNRAGNDPLTNSALEKLFGDYKTSGGKFADNYYEGFGKHLFNTAISQAKAGGSSDLMSMSKGVVKVSSFLDNEEGFGGGKFASVYHAYENLVGTSENTGYDKLMHFSSSAEKTFSFGSKIGAGLGYVKEFFKDEIPSWFGNDKGWDNMDIKANKSGIQFGSQLRSQYGKYLGEFMKKNPPSNEKLPIK